MSATVPVPPSAVNVSRGTTNPSSGDDASTTGTIGAADHDDRLSSVRPADLDLVADLDRL